MTAPPISAALESPAPEAAASAAPDPVPSGATGLRLEARPAFGLWTSLGLALLSGALYFLAFPGIGLWPLGFVTFVPLILALDRQTARRGLFAGWVSGLTMTLFGFYWLVALLETFGGFPPALGVLFLVLLSAYQAGRIGLLGWLTARGQTRGWQLGPLFALAFVASELSFPLLFPWFFGGIVHDLPALVQTAELGGPIAVGLAMVAANLALAEPLLAWRQRRRLRFPVLALLLVPGLTALYGFFRIRAVDEAVLHAPKGKVGLVQANLAPHAKRADQARGLKLHERLTRELERGGPLDLILWSETSMPGAADEQGLEATLRSKLRVHAQSPLLIGAVLARPVDDERGRVLFNSALLLDRPGTPPGRYDKQFLLPFGEYLPFGDTFPSLYRYSPNSGRFTAGENVLPIKLGEHQLATVICYEDVIPSFVRSVVRAGEPDLLVNLTNDAWFGDSTEPWIHLALAQLRAIEHRKYLVRSTNSGVSAIVDPVGRVVAQTKTFEEATLQGEIAWLKTPSLYASIGDAPWWLASAASLAFCFVRRRAPRPAVPAPAERRPSGPPTPPAGRPFWRRITGLIPLNRVRRPAGEPRPPVGRTPHSELRRKAHARLRPRLHFPEPPGE